jgi:pimeloyl-ACP methyl ester carboxylesterase
MSFSSLSSSYINKFIFPTKGIDYSPNELNLIWLKNKNNLYFPNHLIKLESKLIILYLHGNGGSLYDFKNIVTNYSYWLDSSIFAVEYPGFGLAEGESNEDSVNDNVGTAYYFLRDVLGYPSNNIIVIGYSIGTGAGIKLVSDLSLTNNEPGAIILVAAYLSVCDIVKDMKQLKMFNFLSKTIRNRWNSKKNIDSVKCPCMFIHGNIETN